MPRKTTLDFAQGGPRGAKGECRAQMPTSFFPALPHVLGQADKEKQKMRWFLITAQAAALVILAVVGAQGDAANTHDCRASDEVSHLQCDY